MSRRCQLTGKRRNTGMKVSHSHIRTKKVQMPNIQRKRIWHEEREMWIRIRVSTRALRTISKIGLVGFLKKNKMKLRDIT